MRGWMRRPIASALLPFLPLVALSLTVLPLATGNAVAAEAGKPAEGTQAPADTKTGPAAGTAVTMPMSPMAQVPFPQRPFPLNDDGTFKALLDKTATDANRRCSTQEAYGWEFPKGDQSAMDRIFQSTMGAFERAGWMTGEVKTTSLPDPDAVAYLADKDNRRLLMVWIPMSDAAVLLMCETQGSVPKK